MKQPERFSRVVNVGMFVIGGTFVTVGALSYLALGQEAETIVFLNLPKSPVVTGIQIFYAIAVMLSFPLTLYPAIKITETGNLILFTLVIFGHSTGRGSNLIKWKKNLYRASLTSMIGLVAWAGSTNLDKVVSLVGCFACIPLSFIYPSLFHIAITPSPWVRAKDWGLVVFGTLVTLYTTYMTIEQWALTGPDIALDRCHDGFRV
ncbi:neutral amino acid transporter [Globomyces sp. JEL0801]|nr:neutral amino acid transporter [Globomyces sp. JEL0801]